MPWKPQFETVVQVSAMELRLYRRQAETSALAGFQHPERKGIHHTGEFPVAVMRMTYDALGYHAYFSGQERLGPDTYLLTRLPGKRRAVRGSQFLGSFRN